MSTETPLQRALRRNTARLHQHEFLADVAAGLGRPQESIQVIPYEVSTVLLDQLLAHLNGTPGEPLPFRRRWAESQQQELVRFLTSLRQRVPEVPMCLFRRLSEYCGAVSTTSAELLTRAFDLAQLDNEDLLACTGDAKNGISFSYVEERYSGQCSRAYLLTVYGDLFTECSPDLLDDH